MKLLHVFRGLLLLIAVLVFGACEPIPAKTPVGFINERVPLVMVPICAYPTALTTTAISNSARLMWAFSPTMQLVSSADSVQFHQAARHHGRFYVYDRRGDPANAVTMPLGHEMTPCPEAREKLALVKPSKVYLLAGKIVPVPPPPCKLLTERRALALFESQSERLRAHAVSSASNTKLDGRYLGQSAHGAGTLHSPKHPDPVRLAQERELKEVVTKSFAIGNKVGSAVEGIESGLAYLSSHCSRFDQDLRDNPDILADFQNKIAKTLNDLPIPPKYTNPQLQASSEAAFSEGFEAGVGSKKLQFMALNTAATVAILLFPNVYVATETVAAKAVRLAVERLRNIPIYVPAVTNGAGFFLKPPKTLPRPPVGNANAPSPPAGVAPPPPPAVKPPAAAPAAANTATSGLGAAATRAVPNGQLHHGISDAVHKALERHEKLKGLYKLRDPRFTARAATLEDHNGYQKWHQNLDDEVVEYIEKTPGLDPKKFESWLGKRYRKSDLAERFPGGLGENK